MKKKQKKFEKKKKVILEKKRKKGESWGKMTKCKKKRKRNALWITVVIHSILCVGNSDSPHTI
jgi:hypothetical protein